MINLWSNYSQHLVFVSFSRLERTESFPQHIFCCLTNPSLSINSWEVLSYFLLTSTHLDTSQGSIISILLDNFFPR